MTFITENPYIGFMVYTVYFLSVLPECMFYAMFITFLCYGWTVLQKKNELLQLIITVYNHDLLQFLSS